MTIYLYKKTHNKTGLQYLGKTTKDPHKYKGSGEHWIPHIKKHGYDVTTEILRECLTNEEVKHWGLHYSTLWNVVEDGNWANLKPEEGDGGNGKAIMANPITKRYHKARINSPEIKEKHRLAMLSSHKNRSYESVQDKLADSKIYTFYHVTGLVEHCRRVDLIKKYNLSSGHISNMIHQRHRIVKGWKVKD